ncbi:hypothetical protein CEXT_95491 [Caerostris extrusa]|uniref:Uncharacterized protein n=1 Tax=Caerostris extrusa TaxID=172846 RepID=A0AAV4VGW9_CAEEX|nr:hypothetical protein CEXT_95491 [Caerostris extrusa]
MSCVHPSRFRITFGTDHSRPKVTRGQPSGSGWFRKFVIFHHFFVIHLKVSGQSFPQSHDENTTYALFGMTVQITHPWQNKISASRNTEGCIIKISQKMTAAGFISENYEPDFQRSKLTFNTCLDCSSNSRYTFALFVRMPYGLLTGIVPANFKRPYGKYNSV